MSEEHPVSFEVSDKGICFSQLITNHNGEQFTQYCIVPAHEWWSAWEKLKVVKVDQVVQWSFVDRTNSGMVLVESFIEFIHGSHIAKVSLRVVQLAYDKSFAKLEKFSEKKK
tara:strand:- start:15978 stop:16313 length:336 start_codon:yes stop_codon:yes gene_type:complete